MYKVYFDLDGVVVDLATSIERVMGITLSEPRHSTEKHPHVHQRLCEMYESDPTLAIFETAPRLSESFQLWDIVCLYAEPQFLSSTGPLFTSRIRKEKRNWVKKHFGHDTQLHLVSESRLKAAFATPQSILIDDQMASIGPWREQGGIGILHTDLINTLTQIRSLLKG